MTAASRQATTPRPGGRAAAPGRAANGYSGLCHGCQRSLEARPPTLVSARLWSTSGKAGNSQCGLRRSARCGAAASANLTLAIIANERSMAAAFAPSAGPLFGVLPPPEVLASTPYKLPAVAVLRQQKPSLRDQLLPPGPWETLATALAQGLVSISTSCNRIVGEMRLTAVERKMSTPGVLGQRAATILRQQVPEPTWNAWLAPLGLVEVSGSEVCVGCTELHGPRTGGTRFQG